MPRQVFLAKLFHWINLISLTVMITSGLQIYNANPVFGGRGSWQFPPFFLLGGWLAGGRHWHFAAMTVFAVNLFLYGIYIGVTKRWRHRFILSSDFKAIQKSQNLQRRSYAWHRIIYTLIIPVLLFSIVTGLGMYKPAQFSIILTVLGSWQTLRIVHFIAVPIFVVFAIAHSFFGFRVGGVRLIKSIFF